MNTRHLAAISCAVWFLPLIAQAYRNPARFPEPAEDGGGGGKFFTGSRAEGYGCDVCHSRGETIPLEIRGLPIDGYVPSQIYPITIDWPDQLRSVALNLELTDYEGHPLGELLRADPATLTPADLCKSTEVPSTGQELPITPGRSVMTVAECEQQQTTFLWRAPAFQARAYFSTSVLSSNRDSKLGGDHVVDVTRAFGITGQAAPSIDAYASTCSVQPFMGTRTSLWELFAWLALLCLSAVRASRSALAPEHRDTSKQTSALTNLVGVTQDHSHPRLNKI